jgi:nucleotide-binding universal stress UspA family protein
VTGAAARRGGSRRAKEAIVKALVAIDGSRWSRHAVDNVCRRTWPPDSEIELLTVLHSPVPYIPEPTLVFAAAHEHGLGLQADAAPEILDRASRLMQSACPGLRVSRRIEEGRPAQAIVDEARRWGAQVIILGSHGRGRLRRLLLGSVSSAVARRAPCAVEVVRAPLQAR